MVRAYILDRNYFRLFIIIILMTGNVLWNLPNTTSHPMSQVVNKGRAKTYHHILRHPTAKGKICREVVLFFSRISNSLVTDPGFPRRWEDRSRKRTDGFPVFTELDPLFPFALVFLRPPAYPSYVTYLANPGKKRLSKIWR